MAGYESGDRGVDSVFLEEKFQRSPITQQLIQELVATSPKQVLTYERLSEVASVDIRGRQRYFLANARAIALKEYGVVFETKKNVGLVRLPEREICKVAFVCHLNKLKEDNKRYRLKLDAIDPNGLNAGERQEYSVSLVYLGMRHTICEERVEADIRKEVAASPALKIDRNQMLEQLKYVG